MTEDNKLLSCILHNLRECLNSKKCCCFNEVYSLKKINAQNIKSYIFYVYYNKIRAINEAADSTWYIVFMQIWVYPCNIEFFCELSTLSVIVVAVNININYRNIMY